MLRKKTHVIPGLMLAVALVGCANKLPCVAKIYLEQAPVIHRAAILPFDDRGVMEQPIPKTVGMGHYERVKDSGAMVREIVKYEMENAAEIDVIKFDKVDGLLGGDLVTLDQLTNVNGERPIEIGLRLGADIVVAGRVGLCGEEAAPKSPRSYVMGQIDVFETKSGRLIASIEMLALNYPESCRYVTHKMCTDLMLKLRDLKQAALEREKELQNQLYRTRNPLPHADRY